MQRPTPALVVDADPRGLEALAHGFEGEGWRPTVTDDYAGAPHAATLSPAQLAVIVIRDPVGPAMTALRSLRAERPSSLPALVLGPESIRQEARALAGVDFLPLPAFVRDVLTASKLLSAVYQISGRLDGDAALSCSLAEYGLYPLLRAMIGLGRSGILHLERSNRRGELRFSEGELTGVTLGARSGTVALHQLLLWEDASLEIKLRSTVQRGPLTQRPDDLLEDCERFLRDFAHASKELGPTSAALRVDPESAAAHPDAAPGEVGPLLRLFDGQRTLGEAIEESPFRIFDTLRMVSRFLGLGILVRKDPPSIPPSPSTTPTIRILPVRPAERAILTEHEAMVPGLPTPPEAIAPRSRRILAWNQKDQRTGRSKRRKLQGRDGGTLEQGTLNRTSPLQTSAEPDASRPGAGPSLTEVDQDQAATLETKPLDQVNHGTPVASGELRASGTIAASRGGPKGAARGEPVTPSVVIDMDVVASATLPEPAAPAPAPSVASSVQAFGTVQARKSVEAPAPVGFSIEVDPALLAELAAHDAILAAVPPAAEATEAPTAAAVVAFATTESPLADSAVPTTSAPAATPVPAAAPAAAAAPATPSVATAELADAPGRTGTMPTSPDIESARGGRRASSEFNAIESDFFAREADLYKHDHPDSFDDLDHSQAGPGRPRRSR